MVSSMHPALKKIFVKLPYALGSGIDFDNDYVVNIPLLWEVYMSR